MRPLQGAATEAREYAGEKNTDELYSPCSCVILGPLKTAY